MATSLLVGLSARLLQWQNPAECGAQFLNALRGRPAQGTFRRVPGSRSVRQVFSRKVAIPLLAIQNRG
jgi:hypothetical protein